jgi:histidinol-phosphatase
MSRTVFSLDEDLGLALRLADVADAISRERFLAQDLVVEAKPDRTPVTDADKAIERAIIDLLGTERPEDFMLGEEFGEQAGTVAEHPVGTGDHPHRQWIIDPIDGTANFLRGVPVWATLIALAIDGDPVIGVVSAPALGKRWWAAVDSGAWVSESAEPRQLHVSAVSNLADASLSYNNLQQWDQAGYLDELVALSRRVWRTRAYGDMWSYMLLAEGVLDAVAEFDLKPYDMAALIPIVREAGGRFSSVDGHNDCWHGSALATNGHLHNDLLEALRR